MILLTFRDYGVTWDESVQAQYGELVVDYFRSGLGDARAKTFLELKYYGPLVDAAAALLYQFHPAAKYEIRHVLIAVLALLTVFGAIQYARLFDDLYVPFFGSLILMTLPRFYGHAFNNPKDIPLACFFVWSMFLMARIFWTRERRWTHFLGCGAVIGLALAVRPGSLPIFVLYLIAGLVLTVRSEVALEKRRLTDRAHGLLLLQSAALFAVAWIVMVLPWPWAHDNVLLNPLQAVQVAASFIQSYPVLFEGKIFRSDELPGYYLLKYLWITTPPAVIVFAAAGMIRCGRRIFQNPGSRSAVVGAVTLLWFWFPIVYFVFWRPNVYDEVRHFLFILPALAILAGLGAAGLLRLARARKLETPAVAILILVALIPLRDLVGLHPYQMTYFNAFAGGVAKASHEYETDYWVSSYKEAIEWVNRQRHAFPGGRISVLVAANDYSFPAADHYRAPGVQLRPMFQLDIPGTLPEDVDFYVATTRYDFHRNFTEAPVVHTVGREGAVFTVVKGRRR